MKKTFLLIITFLTISAGSLSAQRTGYINSQSVLNEVPEYVAATQQIERLRKQYESQVQSEMKRVEELYNKYQQQKNSLSQSQKREAESQIISLERSAKELQKSFFGQEGALSVRSRELLEPVMTRLETVVKEIAESEDLGMVIDISAMQGVIYYNPRYDLSKRVLEMMNQ
ncbi:MAG: OmpH family outer membrane protein [Bacteroidales bacterium]|nr:OmpH family outer membrane protein [Bacteroidales bacterium]MDD2425644.1 OmpH family outer membrane protein [Bacteroidales bacterium]MDD3988849.1 OmpH family outer membrane protein [Bacteroidales bacterium]MDD4639499.1 OmpH family outer membrane protein [Bacteroidales bacterium]